jgi:hypothetical protein
MKRPGLIRAILADAFGAFAAFAIPAALLFLSLSF